HARGVYMEAKPFSIGFRIEHPQSLIDRARLGPNAGNPLLGAADYKLVHHAKNGRAVYSFCMCPGGTVVAATSEPGRVVTNGMSQYSRNERNANAGIVVGITPADFPGDDPLAGIRLQRELESRAFTLGGGNYDAPAQRVGDFLAGRPTTKLGSVEPSYKPGVRLTDLATALPPYAIEAIREALPAFDKQIKGFAMDDAVLTGVETRTSSPVRITRGDDFQSLNVNGLYPAGEGAGYAGGILSAGVDGIKVAEAVARDMLGLEAASSGSRPGAGCDY
ncbi:MAG: FAD-dependent protein, partial [Planctomycetota bacterium]